MYEFQLFNKLASLITIPGRSLSLFDGPKCSHQTNQLPLPPVDLEAVKVFETEHRGGSVLGSVQMDWAVTFYSPGIEPLSMPWLKDFGIIIRVKPLMSPKSPLAKSKIYVFAN